MRKSFLLLIFVLFWLEAGLNKVFPNSFLIPQFVLLFVVIISVDRELRESLIVAMTGGFLGELFSGLYFGTVMFVMLAGSLLAYFGSRNSAARSLSLSTVWFLAVAATAILPLAAYLFNLAVSGLGLTGAPGFSEFYSWNIVLQICVNLVALFVMNWFYKTFFYE